MKAARRPRLGWIGLVIVAVGVAVACVGAWLIVTGRPRVGAVIDTIAVDARTRIVVRGEEEGERAFVELHQATPEGEKMVWRAIVPPYGGRPGAPGIAWNEVAVSVRVVRDGHDEIFAVSRETAAKLGGFRLAPNHGATRRASSGPVTLTDHVRSYEVVAGADWHQLTAFDLTSGEASWRVELGPEPIAEGGVADEIVWVRQGSVTKRFRTRDGTEAYATANATPGSS
ncbi:MAG: hypothetical protein KF773_00275 [Deltaproteobacteria bacterium]|nr:hypothetical protein [Deltaproteobacteria bacterium]